MHLLRLLGFLKLYACFQPSSMAEAKLAFLSLFLLFSLIISGVRAEADASQIIQEVRSDGGDDFSVLRVELGQLKSKIQLLDTRLEETNAKLKAKDEKISQLEKVVQVKSDTVASLQGEIEVVQKKGTSDAEERAIKAHAQATELQKQIEKLKMENEGRIKEKDALDVRARESEKRVEELSSDLNKLQKINDEQKTRIHKAERALQAEEEELMKAKLEANSRTKELMNVHGAWLPPWILDHLICSRSFLEAEWNDHGRPAMDVLIQKLLEKKGRVEKWAAPHIAKIKTKWAPALKEQWLMAAQCIEPHVQVMTAKTVEMYEASKTSVKPHIIKVQELADPYYQKVKKVSKPYINQVATIAKPHVQKARSVLKPYTKKAIHVYGKFLESATMYHRQVQATVHEKLKQHELTRALATKELVWFVASALLALPVIILSRICSSCFCKSSKKPARSSHAHHHTRRKGKRGYPDK